MIWLVTFPFKVGFRTGRLLGYRRIFVFGLGVAVGLLLAPTTGAALRRRVMERVEGDLPNDPVPAEAPSGYGRDVVDLTLEAR